MNRDLTIVTAYLQFVALMNRVMYETDEIVKQFSWHINGEDRTTQELYDDLGTPDDQDDEGVEE